MAKKESRESAEIKSSPTIDSPLSLSWRFAARSAGLAQVESSLRKKLHVKDVFAHRLLAYAAAGRGKRLRARLVLLAARAVGRLNARVEHLATAVELLHQATLVHDDIIDHSSQRRHRATLNARFGNQAAVLAGDYIVIQAMRIMQDMPARIRSLMVAAATQVCLGEIEELQYRAQARPSIRQYLEIAGHKTASLFAAACEGGAILAQATSSQAKQLARFGRYFGLAFQIRDDVLDVTGTARELGKPTGQDAEAGRITLPVILGMRLGTRAQRQQLLRQKQHRLQAGRVREILQDCGAMARAEQTARGFATCAQRALAGLPRTAAVRELHALAELAACREY